MKLKSPYKNIYTVLQLNRWVVLASIIGSVITTVVSLLMVIKLHKETIRNAFVVSREGDVIPLEIANNRENLKIEALAHLEKFHRYFYGLEAGGYKTQIEKALWLGDSSVDEVYRQKKMEGFYNRLVQYALVQQVKEVSSEVLIQDDVISFKCRVLFEISRGTVTDRYELQTSGELMQVKRNFPHNPHGLLIKGFFENSLQKLEP
ncbi:conjugal transfer protein TraK [Galbibacter sp. BG1]|uniref:conjugal transfer protein TraK n=1 Tax=Galbibacter sp. BG1 TaxID=1170699 RepID=UPI0015B7D7B9|nr:conjugal transfer protein TraK [Galbibacter sp. BG1]QLE02008.1 conjugal transfer protein TraK [Galbibacter sp. BG1]